jgi:hypothetical protein
LGFGLGLGLGKEKDLLEAVGVVDADLGVPHLGVLPQAVLLQVDQVIDVGVGGQKSLSDLGVAAPMESLRGRIFRNGRLLILVM